MSNLRVQGNVSGSGTITLVTPNTNSTYEVLLPAAGGSIAVGPQGSTGQIQYNSSGVFAGSSALVFDAGILRVEGTGNIVRFGDGTNTFDLRFRGANNWALQYAPSTDELSISRNSVTQYVMNGAAHIWSVPAGERLRINSNGALVLAGGATAADGVGIAFPATQSASSNANALDDYEEGTWTPTYLGETTAGSTTYTTQLGKYTKIGNVVYCNMQLSWSAASGTGYINIGGLPFSAVSGSLGTTNTTMPYMNNITVGAGLLTCMRVTGNTTFARVGTYPLTGGSNGYLSIDSAGDIEVTFFYYTAT